MGIDKHVVSLELAKQLYEAGIVVENPQFVWRYSDEHPEGVIISPVMSRVTSESIHTVPAPLASEIGELLPMDEDHFYSCQKLSRWEGDVFYRSYRSDFSKKSYIHISDADTMPDAMAKMLLYLREKGLI